MSSNRPVGDDPFKYRVEAIQSDKHEKEPKQEPSLPKGSIVIAFLISTFRKLFDLFEGSKKETGAISEETVETHLLQIKSLFEILKTENRSEDAPFINELSLAWHNLLDDSLNLSKTTPWNLQFWAFIKEIQHYPNNQEHTLGYYLTEYAGQKWLPFPYMEMIQKIYAEHRDHPQESALVRWTRLIDELLNAPPE